MVGKNFQSSKLISRLPQLVGGVGFLVVFWFPSSSLGTHFGAKLCFAKPN
jgi:hypothetical protein